MASMLVICQLKDLNTGDVLTPMNVEDRAETAFKESYNNIQSASEDSGYGLFTYEIYKEFHIKLYGSSRCMAIVIYSLSSRYKFKIQHVISKDMDSYR